LIQRGAERKLLLVIAPAGYGKTTAVLGWVQQQPQPVCLAFIRRYATDDLSGFVVVCRGCRSASSAR
jgi:hypothetical protein